MIARLQVREVAGYDEDAVFLVVPDGSNFGKRVPIVIGTCTLARVINVIKESEMDRISTPWSTVRLAQLLSRRVVTEGTPSEGGAGTPEKNGVDTVIEMGSSAHVGSFQTDIGGKDFSSTSMRCACNGNTCGLSGIGAGWRSSATSRVTSTAYLHDHHGWLQTNTHSSAEHD